MSDFDSDIEALLAEVMKGNNPQLDALDTPKPLDPEPEPDEEPLSPETGDVALQLADILADENSTPVSQDPQNEDSLHTCKDGDEAEAALPEIDYEAWSKEVKDDPIELPEFTTDELMADLDVRNFGMLVSLNTQRWHAKTRDHKAATDAANATGADARAFEARKRLLVGADEKLKAVHTAIDAARTEHYKMTLPWSTIGVNDFGKRAGPRLLPNTLFFEYTEKMGKFKQDMVASLDAFVKAYPNLIAVAQSKLGGSFKASDYPAPSQIGRYFDLSFDFLPIPVAADFDSVQLQQADKLAAAINRKTRKMLENAMQDAWKQLLDDVTHAYNSLSNPNARFHFTLIDKMRDHATMLNHLNVTKDPRIENIRKAIDKGLVRWDIKEIKKDDALRARMAESAKGILTMMQEYTANG